ncbi:MAG: hypothetical protein ACYSYT_05225, partial [Planctomycetota bacterium]
MAGVVLGFYTAGCVFLHLSILPEPFESISTANRKFVPDPGNISPQPQPIKGHFSSITIIYIAISLVFTS